MEDFRTRWEKQYHLVHTVFSDTQKLLIAQDAKAGVVISLNCFIIGIISTELNNTRELFLDPHIALAIKGFLLLLIFLFLICFLKSIFFSFGTFFPRFAPRFHMSDVEAEHLKKLIFAGHILEKEGPHHYFQMVKDSSDNDLIMEFSSQIWQISGIFQIKFEHCSQAIFFMKGSLWLGMCVAGIIELIQWVQ